MTDEEKRARITLLRQHYDYEVMNLARTKDRLNSVVEELESLGERP